MLSSKRFGRRLTCCGIRSITIDPGKPRPNSSKSNEEDEHALYLYPATGIKILRFSRTRRCLAVCTAGGCRTNGYRNEEQMNRLQAVRHLAKETGHTPNQIVLAWMLQNAPVAIPLVAVSDSIQLEENLGALDIQLSSEQLDYLNQA
ncbi:aldo/keto reductase [Paenibacillus sp. 8b26]|uniref:aldo/keto reductase n=1 Tax=Paenibacillus sp. 8b26 TaxID=3424133 RepID=UPI003D64C096